MGLAFVNLCFVELFINPSIEKVLLFIIPSKLLSLCI